MAPPIWTRLILKSLAAAGGTISIITYGINYDSCYAASIDPPSKPAYPFHTPSVPWDSNWDKRDPESLVKPPANGDECEREKELAKLRPKVTRHIFLVRHGQYSMDGQGDEEKGLSCLGKDQAKLTGQRLHELAFPYTIIVRSTMSRATETADIIAKSLPGVPAVSCDMIREGAPIPPEPAVSHWRPEAQFYEDGARIEAAFRKYFHRADPCQEQDSYEVMVCHSNVIRYFVCRAMQFPPEAWLRFSLHNCSLTWLVIHPSGRVVLKALGDSGHIPTDKLTTS